MEIADLSARALWLVSAREYRERILARSFIVTTILVPLVLGLFSLMPMLLRSTGVDPAGHSNRRRTAVVVCGDRKLAELIAMQIDDEPPGDYRVQVDSDSSPGERGRLYQQLRVGLISAFAWVDDDALVSGRVAYYDRGVGRRAERFYLRHVIEMALAKVRLSGRGISADEIGQAMRPTNFRSFAVQAAPQEMAEPTTLLGPFMLAYVLFFTFVSYGAMLMQSVIEEKLSRVAEVLLVSTRPEELMAGKIIGVGCVGLTQMGIWLTLGALVAVFYPGARSVLETGSLSIGHVIYFVLFYLLGYLLYSALYAVAGVSSDGASRSSPWTGLIMLPILAALSMLPFVIQAPGSSPAVIASMVPYLAPILMYGRIAAAPTPGWQIALSIILMAVTIAVSTVICARIYRVGILMYGKRASLRELARWIRYA